ncbi:hypothetical protein ACHWQZ_G007389 [Mnemiopsis leidyi]
MKSYLRRFTIKYVLSILIVLNGLYVLLEDHKVVVEDTVRDTANVSDVKHKTLNTGEMKEKKVRTQDIPYRKFDPPIGKRWALAMIRKRHPNLRFLTEMVPSNKTAISELCDFGDPSRMNCSATQCHLNGRTVRREIVKENPNDTFTFLPKNMEFLKEFKNPCWKGKDDSGRESLFCVPYFFLAGVTKSGTTDLFNMLISHALIGPQTAEKEPHYLDRKRRGRSFRMHQPPLTQPMSFTYYASNLNNDHDSFLMRTYLKVEGADVLIHGITMDASPSYIWDNEYWETFHPGFKEPPVTNPDTLALINPSAKIIIALRDPIDRMRSAYQFFCANVVKSVYKCDRPITPEKYHNLVVEAVERFNRCLHNNSVRGCAYSTDTHQLATHLYASIYHVYMLTSSRYFPRNSCLSSRWRIGSKIRSRLR